MVRPRAPEHEGWPANLREPRPGYYTYRSPLTGREVSLGRNLEEAKRQARQQNRDASDLRGAKRSLRQDAVHGVRDQRGLLEASHIAAEALLYDSVCGVCFLLEDEEIVYIGQSTDVLRRLSQHRLDPQKSFNRVHLLQCQPAELPHLEAMYIDKFRPRYNAFMPPVTPGSVVWRGSFASVFQKSAG